MRGVERFEDLIAWQKARCLTRDVYQVTRLPLFSKDFNFRDQIRAAALSVPSNIAEGFERKRPGRFKEFLSVAKASCAEVRSQLYSAYDVGYIDEATFKEKLELSREVGRLIGGLYATIR